MDSLEPVGRTLLIIGLVIAVVGIILVLAPRIPFIGRLPGDIRIERDGVVVFIPLGTMLLVSLLLTVVLNLIGRR
jgi:predicted membrane channel-forming protein YqfA (hemolysin III family)